MTAARVRTISSEFLDIRNIALKVNSDWFIYNVMRKRLQSVLIALSDYFSLSHLITEEESVTGGLFRVGTLLKRFDGKVTQKQILEIIQEEMPEVLNIYSCYFECLLSSKKNLNKLFKKYKIDEKWKPIIHEEWNIYQSMSFQ